MSHQPHAWLSCGDDDLTPTERAVEAALHYLEAVQAVPDADLEELADCLDILFSLWEQTASR